MRNKLLKNIFSIKNTNDKSHKVLTVLGINFKFKRTIKRDYSLKSGERQTATTLKNIRQDHLNRYNLAINVIKKYSNNFKKLYGLDIFCGNGYGSYLISECLNTYIDSYDASKDAIKCANKYYKNTDVNYYNKIFPFQLPRNKYDYIISMESIEHIKDDDLFLNLLSDSINNNSDLKLLIISTPNEAILSHEKFCNKFHFKHYYNEEFINLLSNKGFELLELYGQDTYTLDNDGGVKGSLKPEEMELKRGYNGQFTIYVFKKL